jgi:hypothetical protein
MKSFILFIFVSVFSISLLTAEQNQQQALQQFNTKDKSNFFIENKGQWDSEVLYLAKINGLNAWITKSGVVYDYFIIEKEKKTVQNDKLTAPDKYRNDLDNSKIKGHVIEMIYKQGSGETNYPESSGIGMLEAYYNYFLGNDSTKWASYVPLYESVIIKNAFKGIDTKYYYDMESKGSIRYDFIVNPQSEVSDIKLNFDLGKDKSYYYTVNGGKELVFKANIGEISHTKLYAYQETNGIKNEVECTFTVNKDGSIGFTVGNYDNAKQLVIDPLVYSTFLGGNGDDDSYCIQIDGLSNVYITGWTNSSNFPTTTGAYDESFNGGINGDIFVSKINPTGTELIFSSFIGGSDDDYGLSIVFDSNWDLLITGMTYSNNYPTTDGAYDRTHNGDGSQDVFVTKLNSTGTSLIFSTFIGGNSDDVGRGIAIDEIENAYITGWTWSTNYPTTTGAYDVIQNGTWDAIVTKINPSGTALVYSTFIGGSEGEGGISIVLDNSGNAYINGHTQSTNYPTTIGVFNEDYNGGDYDVFVTKVNSSGTGLIYSTYIGGAGADIGYAMALDSGCNVYITGYTESNNYPTTNGSFNQIYQGNTDAYVTKLNPNGTGLVYSTYLGGSDNDAGSGISIDSEGNVYIEGGTASNDFPTTVNGYDQTINGEVDFFITKLNPSGSALVYSTYFGGSAWDWGGDLTIDNNNDIFFTGDTKSIDFPKTVGAFDESFNGSVDVIITKLHIESIPPTPILISPSNNSTKLSINPEITWNAAAEATSYCLQISTSNDFGILTVNDSNITSTNYNASSLSYNTTYFWRVNAKNIAGTSPWSEVWNFTTECDPNQLFSISGIVSYNNTQGTPLSNCTVNLIDSSGYLTLQTFTDNNGYYYFGFVYPGDYKIEVTTTKPRGGFNVLDVVLTRQEIAFLIQFTPLQVKAADVNKNNSLNMLDVVYMKQKLAFLNPPQWIISDYVFEVPTINVCGENVIVNIKALCAGDVNGSYVPPE